MRDKMKKKKVYIIISITGALLLIIALVYFSSVGSTEKTTFHELQLPFVLGEDEYTTMCYTDENTILLSLRERLYVEPVPQTPPVRNKYVYMWDYLDSSSKPRIFSIGSDNAIYSAVPYKDGILYVDTSFSQDRWEVIFINKDGPKVIDSGKSKVNDDILNNNNLAPYLRIVGNVPVYLCQRYNSEKDEIAFELMAIDDFDPLRIEFIDEEYEIFDTLFFTNGEKYCFKAYKNNQLNILTGDIGGVREAYPILENQWIFSYGITDDWLIYSCEDLKGQAQLVKISLNDSEKTVEDQSFGSYRIKGSKGNICLCVNDQYELFEVDVESMKLRKIPLPEENFKKYNYRVDSNMPIELAPADEKSFIMNYGQGHYFRVVLR